ncbi:MAG: excinuclease ABC subunit UvrC [Alphaproteobacteria bacterium]|nr:excinuclease ABC subunit UvrC [Alphaproteobacteria bacterium]
MTETHSKTSLQIGAETIRDACSRLPLTPGVYRMIAEDGEVLYVGKARELKKRVSSYVAVDRLPVRLQRMVALTRRMEFIGTQTEAEALLLEANLIKKLGPRFNILLRDDKSFPYILIREDHAFPQVLKHRGAKSIQGTYFGPFAGAGDVNRSIAVLQRAFLLRNCTDSVFSHRERPCLQYHIKRCTAPCVGMVDEKTYGAQVKGARDFLSGKSRAVQARMTEAMQAASARMDYEEAAGMRDRLRALASVLTRQDVNLDGVGDADVLALYCEKGVACVQVFFFRAGQNLGNRAYFPRHDGTDAEGDILHAFIGQFYQNKPVPGVVIVSHDMDEGALLEEALVQHAGHKVQLVCPKRGARRRALDFALRNARDALERQSLIVAGQAKLLAGVADLFGLEEPPQRIEVYDNSHISGTNMVGAMIVAGPEGFNKKAYRTFNIKQAGASDDYGMMREVLTRRFRRALKEQDEGKSSGLPDLVLIDGGLGQLGVAREVLEECGLDGDVMLVGIAKGEDRNAGREKFFIQGREMFQLPVNDPVLHYLQRLRDEAHRFAIGTHRARRKKQISASPLDDVAGIGAKRKKALLLHFGSAKAVAGAGVEDLMQVEGISRAVAEGIYAHFHG